MPDTYRPPKGVQEEAARALEWIADGYAGDGFTDTGRRRASQLAAGDPVSEDVVLRMYSYLKRHEVDQKADGFNAGEEGFPTPGRVAWSAWGGAPGLAWSTRIRDEVLARMSHVIGALMDTRAEDVYGVTVDPVGHGIMAADAALDAAASLLMGNADPVVSQAYYLICAADAALDEAQEALGLVDVDDELSEGEPVEEEDDLEEMLPVRAQDESERVLVEARKRIAGAERITVDAQIRAAADGGMRIAGYAAMFNREASSLPFREMIAPGAFQRSIVSGEPIYLLVNHDMEQLPLASTRSGTLRLSEDDLGLFMEADLDPQNPRAAELHSALARGDVDKMSFAFSINEDGETREDGVRVLRDLNLYEVSVVTWPAYDATEVGVRAEPVDDALALRRRQVAARLQLLK